MTVHSAQAPTTGETWDDETIDLRRYVAVLWSRWPEILLVTLVTVGLTAAGVLLYRAVAQPVYEATATAAIVRTLTDVRFDDRYTTSSDQPNLDVNSRRAALVSMVESGAVAEAVANQLGDKLTPEERNPAKLLEMVSGGMALVGGRTGQSDLISIQVKADTPQKAAMIANAWAAAYVEQVNRVYGQVPDEMMGTVQQQLADAQAQYKKAQADLENFLATSELDALQRQLQSRQDTIHVLEQGKVQALDSYVKELMNSYNRIVTTYLNAQTSNQLLAFSKEQEGLRARITAYLNAYNAAQVDTFTAQSDRDRAQLRLYYDQWLRTTAGLVSARTLRDQLDSVGDGAAPATALALQVLKVQLVNGASQMPLPLSDLYRSPQQLAGNPPQPANQTVTADSANMNDATAETNKTPAVQLTNQTVQMSPPASSQPASGSGSALQIQLNGAGATTSAADLRTDLDATIRSLEGQLAGLENDIAALNQSMLSGKSFQNLNATMPDNSDLVKAITDAYPDLFGSGVLSATSELATTDGALLAAGQAQARNLLSNADASSLPTADSPDAPMAQAIAQLESEIRALKSKVETETSRNLQFNQQRDLAWESYKALSNKQAELQLARAAGNSEVRLSSVAVDPATPVERISLVLSLLLATVIGLLLGVLVAFLLALMDVPPLRQRRAARRLASGA